MPSAPVIDVETLLKPIAGDAPAGVDLPFDVRQQLGELRLDKPNDDPPKKPDWRTMQTLATETLQNTSKHLVVAAHLLEALVKQYGFPGARDGFRLLQELVDKCWDRIHPLIVEGDVGARAGVFNWLDSQDRSLRFPGTIRLAPLIKAEGGVSFSWTDWKQPSNGQASRELFDKAVEATSLETCQKLGEDIAIGKNALDQLVKTLETRMGKAEAPVLLSIRSAVNDCHTLIQQILEKKRPPPEQKEHTPTGDGAQPAARPAPALNTRDEIYKQLKQAAAALKKLEPHSPIPYLIERAVDLGSKQFPEMIKDLVRDQKILADVNRELGIVENPAAKKEPGK
jgi:type VI secretion system protein ImpA